MMNTIDRSRNIFMVGTCLIIAKCSNKETMMKVNAVVLLSLMLFGYALRARGIEPATSILLATIDHISDVDVGKVLKLFCEKNDCRVKNEASYAIWNIYVRHKMNLVSVGRDCVPNPRLYCVDAWGAKGRAYMNEARITALTTLLEDYGAKVTFKEVRDSDKGDDKVNQGKRDEGN